MRKNCSDFIIVPYQFIMATPAQFAEVFNLCPENLGIIPRLEIGFQGIEG